MENKSKYKISDVREIPIKDIDIPENVRLEEREKDIISLMESIKLNGLLQPVGVYKNHSRYIYVFGYRRIQAYKKLGYATILSKIFQENKYGNEIERAFLNVIENLQREDVSPFELGRVCIGFKKEGLTSPEIAARIGCSRTKIVESIQLYNSAIPDDLQKNIVYTGGGRSGIKKGQLSASNAHLITKMGLTGDNYRKFITYTKEKEYGMPQIQAISELISKGMSIDQAFDQFDDWIVKSSHLIMNKKKLNKLIVEHNITYKDLIVAIMKGEISYDRNLIY